MPPSAPPPPLLPTLVIHALGQPSRRATFQAPPIRVGRDPGSDLVLAGETVSRSHAVLGPDAAGRWWVACVSDTNPIVVDGTAARRKYLREGSEILIGQEHLVVFWMSEKNAAESLGEQGGFVTTECLRCQWKGMIRASWRDATCPDCGSRDLLAENAYAREHEIERIPKGPTSQMSTAHLHAHLARLKTAKGSRLERLDGRAPERAPLKETEPLHLSRDRTAALRLFGLTYGGAVLIEWAGKGFLATSTVVFPGMRVNGVLTTQAPLKHEDVIEVGPNRFRFVTE